MITVGIVGPESTGKTTLAKSLAKYFKTEWVPEYARKFLTEHDRPYEKADLIEIAKGQLEEERRGRKRVKDLLILDTDLTVIKIWSEFKYGDCDPWIKQQLLMNPASIYLLTHHDIPYEKDPLRETPSKRPELFDLYEAELAKSSTPYLVVKGDEDARLSNSIQAISAIL